MGPPIAASLLLLAARPERSSRIALMGCALFCALLVLLWAGNLLTLFYAGVMGLALAALALRGTPVVLQWSSLFIAVQLGLASFSRADYLFTAVAQTSAGPMPSEVAQIEAALWLPYWVWGAGLAVLSALLLVGSSGVTTSSGMNRRTMRHLGFKQSTQFPARSPGTLAGTVPTPGVIFHVSESQWRVFACTSRGRPVPDTPLFHAPTLNTYEDGVICVGAVKTPGSTAAECIRAWSDAFWRSNFTHANYDDAVKYGGDAAQLWRDAMDGKFGGRFPNRVLRPHDFTVGEYIERLRGRV